MSSQICRSASRAARSLISASRSSHTFSEGRVIAAAAAASIRGKAAALSSFNNGSRDSANAFRGWISGALALPAAGLDYNIIILRTLFSRCYVVL